MIFKGSRYATSDVVTPPTADGTSPRVLAPRVAGPAPGAFTHTVAEGDRLDTLAARFYGEPTRYWVILDANPEPLNPFELLVPGRPIRIPKNRIVGE